MKNGIKVIKLLSALMRNANLFHLPQFYASIYGIKYTSEPQLDFELSFTLILPFFTLLSFALQFYAVFNFKIIN